MSRLIDGVISELQSIPDALGYDDPDPTRRPRRPSATPEVAQISSEPTIDSSGLEITDQRRWDDTKQRARREVEGDGSSAREGIEALAWYVSFHHHPEKWGIYIPLSSLVILDELYLSGLRMGRDRRLALAWELLIHHEQMHFAVDYACAQFELLMRAPIRRELVKRSDLKLTDAVHADPYIKVEETAANAHMLRKVGQKQSQRTLRAIEQLVRSQPPGYREGLGATSKADFQAAINQTLCHYLALWAIEHRLDIANPAVSLSSWVPLDEQSLSECPVYVIRDLADAGISPESLHLIHSIAQIVETKSFQKQFKKQHPKIQNDWRRNKEQIKVGLPAPPRFEKLKDRRPPTWSLRLRDGHRVHFHSPEPGEVAWRAVGIGTHKEMGHG